MASAGHQTHGGDMSTVFRSNLEDDEEEVLLFALCRLYFLLKSFDLLLQLAIFILTVLLHVLFITAVFLLKTQRLTLLALNPVPSPVIPTTLHSALIVADTQLNTTVQMPSTCILGYRFNSLLLPTFELVSMSVSLFYVHSIDILPTLLEICSHLPPTLMQTPAPLLI